MNATTINEQATYRRPADIYPEAAGTQGGIGGRILRWLGRIAERSSMARRADTFARLNALSDEELAARGLHRQELLVRCFGGRVLI